MPRLGAFTPGVEPQYPLNRRLVGSQFRSGRVGEEGISVPAKSRSPIFKFVKIITVLTELPGFY
jgi:hypothetical protein